MPSVLPIIPSALTSTVKGEVQTESKSSNFLDKIKNQFNSDKTLKKSGSFERAKLAALCTGVSCISVIVSPIVVGSVAVGGLVFLGSKAVKQCRQMPIRCRNLKAKQAVKNDKPQRKILAQELKTLSRLENLCQEFYLENHHFNEQISEEDNVKLNTINQQIFEKKENIEFLNGKLKNRENTLVKSLVYHELANKVLKEFKNVEPIKMPVNSKDRFDIATDAFNQLTLQAKNLSENFKSENSDSNSRSYREFASVKAKPIADLISLNMKKKIKKENFNASEFIKKVDEYIDKTSVSVGLQKLIDKAEESVEKYTGVTKCEYIPTRLLEYYRNKPIETSGVQNAPTE